MQRHNRYNYNYGKTKLTEFFKDPSHFSKNFVLKTNLFLKRSANINMHNEQHKNNWLKRNYLIY